VDCFFFGGSPLLSSRLSSGRRRFSRSRRAFSSCARSERNVEVDTVLAGGSGGEREDDDATVFLFEASEAVCVPGLTDSSSPYPD